MSHDQPAVPAELTEVGELDAVAITDRGQVAQARRVDGQHHSFLGFAEPDLPRRQAGVLQRRPGQVDHASQGLGHLANRRGQPARPAVGDGGVQAGGLVEHVDEQLLGDRVADLHAGPGYLARGPVHGPAAERRPADAVAPGSPADDDHPVAGVGPGQRGVEGGRDTDASGVHQGVRGVPRVVHHGPGNGGQADLVAVVGDAGDHPVGDPQGMQHAVGRLALIGWAEAQDVGHGDGPVGGAHHVPDHPAHTGVRPAEGFDGAGVVVRLGLQGDGAFLGERHDAGVSGEGVDHPWPVDLLGREAQLCQQRRDQRTVGQADGGAERGVGAVLAPGLGDHLQFGVRGLTAHLPEVLGNRLHLAEIQR